jgi:hypothetical protein
MSKPIDPTPDVISWLASQMWGVLILLGGGVAAILIFLGKDFWMSRVIEPHEQTRRDLLEMKNELSEVRCDLMVQKEKNADMEKELAIQTVMIQASLKAQDMNDKKLDTIIEMLMKQPRKG